MLIAPRPALVAARHVPVPRVARTPESPTGSVTLHDKHASTEPPRCLSEQGWGPEGGRGEGWEGCGSTAPWEDDGTGREMMRLSPRRE